jgi:transposase-like protein
MPRGYPHPPEVRAQVVAAVLTGRPLTHVAAEHHLDKGLVSRWCRAAGVQPDATSQRARAGDELANLLLALISAHLEALHQVLHTASRQDWLYRQDARSLARLFATEADTLIRLLAGLRPLREDEPPHEFRLQ